MKIIFFIFLCFCSTCDSSSAEDGNVYKDRAIIFLRECIPANIASTNSGDVNRELQFILRKIKFTNESQCSDFIENVNLFTNINITSVKDLRDFFKHVNKIIDINFPHEVVRNFYKELTAFFINDQEKKKGALVFVDLLSNRDFIRDLNAYTRFVLKCCFKGMKANNLEHVMNFSFYYSPDYERALDELVKISGLPAIQIMENLSAVNPNFYNSFVEEYKFLKRLTNTGNNDLFSISSIKDTDLYPRFNEIVQDITLGLEKQYIPHVIAAFAYDFEKLVSNNEMENFILFAKRIIGNQDAPGLLNKSKISLILNTVAKKVNSQNYTTLFADNMVYFCNKLEGLPEELRTNNSDVSYQDIACLLAIVPIDRRNYQFIDRCFAIPGSQGVLINLQFLGGLDQPLQDCAVQYFIDHYDYFNIVPMSSFFSALEINTINSQDELMTFLNRQLTEYTAPLWNQARVRNGGRDQLLAAQSVAHEVHEFSRMIVTKKVLGLIPPGEFLGKLNPNKAAFNDVVIARVKDILSQNKVAILNFENTKQKIRETFGGLVKSYTDKGAAFPNYLNPEVLDRVIRLHAVESDQDVLAAVVTFVPSEQHQIWLQTYMAETAKAYDSGGDEESCIKGVKERSVTSLRNTEIADAGLQELFKWAEKIKLLQDKKALMNREALWSNFIVSKFNERKITKDSAIKDVEPVFKEILEEFFADVRIPDTNAEINSTIEAYVDNSEQFWKEKILPRLN